MFKEYFLYYQECVKDLKSQYEQSFSEAFRNLQPKRKAAGVIMLISLILFFIFYVLAVILKEKTLLYISGGLLLILLIALLFVRKYDNENIVISRFEKMDDRIRYVCDLNTMLKTQDASKNYLYPVKSAEHYESLKGSAEKERDAVKEGWDNYSKIVSFAFSVIMTVGIESLTDNNLIAFAALIIAYGIAGLLFYTEITEKILKPYDDFISDLNDIIDYENNCYI